MAEDKLQLTPEPVEGLTIEFPGGATITYGTNDTIKSISKLEIFLKTCPDENIELELFKQWMLLENIVPPIALKVFASMYGPSVEVFDAWVEVAWNWLGKEEGTRYIETQVGVPFDALTDRHKIDAVGKVKPG